MPAVSVHLLEPRATSATEKRLLSRLSAVVTWRCRFVAQQLLLGQTVMAGHLRNAVEKLFVAPVRVEAARRLSRPYLRSAVAAGARSRAAADNLKHPSLAATLCAPRWHSSVRSGDSEEGLALQDRFAPGGVCFGCGTTNKDGLQIKSFAEDREDGSMVLRTDWSPQPHPCLPVLAASPRPESAFESCRRRRRGARS